MRDRAPSSIEAKSHATAPLACTDVSVCCFAPKHSRGMGYGLAVPHQHPTPFWLMCISADSAVQQSAILHAARRLSPQTSLTTALGLDSTTGAGLFTTQSLLPKRSRLAPDLKPTSPHFCARQVDTTVLDSPPFAF